jgi:hypothetical protein
MSMSQRFPFVGASGFTSENYYRSNSNVASGAGGAFVTSHVFRVFGGGSGKTIAASGAGGFNTWSVSFDSTNQGLELNCGANIAGVNSRVAARLMPMSGLWGRNIHLVLDWQIAANNRVVAWVNGQFLDNIDFAVGAFTPVGGSRLYIGVDSIPGNPADTAAVQSLGYLDRAAADMAELREAMAAATLVGDISPDRPWAWTNRWSFRNSALGAGLPATLPDLEETATTPSRGLVRTGGALTRDIAPAEWVGYINPIEAS